MKKILCIVPILVFAMVALTQNVNAQGKISAAAPRPTQFFNASDGVTGSIVNALGQHVLTITGNSTLDFATTGNSPIVLGNGGVVLFEGTGGTVLDSREIPEASARGTIDRIVIGSSDNLDGGGSNMLLFDSNSNYNVTVTADHRAVITQFTHSR